MSADWREIRAGILLRANNACERCRAPNGDTIGRGCDRDAGTYITLAGYVFDAETGEHRGRARGSEYEAARFVRIVLTVAHLDHNEAHNDPANLRALCQRCHLTHDAGDNAHRRRASRIARAGQKALPGVAP